MQGAQLDRLDETEKLYHQLISWTGHHNAFSKNPAVFLGEWRPNPAIDPGLSGWKQYWNDPETGSLEGCLRYLGGDIAERALRAPQQLAPEDFRLHPESAGHAAGPDGKDLGADVDLVGPGKAYERWKKTPKYQEWLKETGQR